MWCTPWVECYDPDPASPVLLSGLLLWHPSCELGNGTVALVEAPQRRSTCFPAQNFCAQDLPPPPESSKHTRVACG